MRRSDIDKSSYNWVLNCGACHPGGGPSEFDRQGNRYDEYANNPGNHVTPLGDNFLDGDYYQSDWVKSGVGEADCLICHLKGYDWNLIAKRMWSKIDESKHIEEGMSDIQTLTVYKGSGEFTGEYQMQVKNKENQNIIGEFKGEKFVIASGARSFIPPIEGLEEVGYVTSESFFGEKFPKHPWKSLIIIGGGIIAAEFSHIFSAFGTEITMVEMLPRLLSTEEPDISDR